MSAEEAWERVRDRVHARDACGVADVFTPQGRWQNVPHPPAIGRQAIEALLDPILRRAERVRWDIVSASFEDGRAWLERVDRFWIDGVEYAVACNGVVEIDAGSGLIAVWRDYLDLGEWRTRLAAAGPLR